MEEASTLHHAKVQEITSAKSRPHLECWCLLVKRQRLCVQSQLRHLPHESKAGDRAVVLQSTIRPLHAESFSLTFGQQRRNRATGDGYGNTKCIVFHSQAICPSNVTMASCTPHTHISGVNIPFQAQLISRWWDVDCFAWQHQGSPLCCKKPRCITVIPNKINMQ